MHDQLPTLARDAAGTATSSFWGRAARGVVDAAAVLAVGAGTLAVPTVDDTPPEARLTVTVDGRHYLLNSRDVASMWIQIEPEQRVVLTAVAADADGGVADVVIDGRATVRSIHGGDVRRVHTGYRADNPDLDDQGRWKRPGQPASPERATTLSISGRDLLRLCEQGDAFDGACATFHASVRNFHGLTARTPEITIQVRP